tara:strand:+ start:601 stop:750 length:150 start_codon:yes stop_codon:yes gene_type:complete
MSDWGRRKRNVVFTLQGDCTEKQTEKIYERMLKIAEKYNLGAGWTDEDW